MFEKALPLIEEILTFKKIQRLWTLNVFEYLMEKNWKKKFCHFWNFHVLKHLEKENLEKKTEKLGRNWKKSEETEMFRKKKHWKNGKIREKKAEVKFKVKKWKTLSKTLK